MYSSFGVNLDKQYSSLSRRTKIPKIRHRECEDDCECHMSEKYFKEMNGAVDYLKDKLKDFKNSVSMEMGMDEDNINISCCSHDYCISKKHLALIGVGTLAFVLGVKAMKNHR
ncbi:MULTISPECIES: hypothetical protein [Clostridium]|jgi:hypothetical protein|uniref:Uncharacterized protein n=1 Tax=Clostridium intestinale DSM 6191 TaxID=1121320 RepID=A0A1M5ZC58_9CLOT|nr:MULTISPECIES: hypothetical protein [Clostridium]SHI21749.1 hypothetical protein SAMN02745941_02764 [Clostridium intestinale DSM 6191]